mgnify:CR=1 FL=1
MSYSLEDKFRARALFVEEGLTYDEVSAETDISESQLKKWGKEGGWVEAQKDFEKEYLEGSVNLRKLSIEMTRKALESKHSQDVIAVTNLLRAMPSARKARNQIDKAALFIDWCGGLIDFLKVRDGEALRYLQPHIESYAASMKEAG